LPDASEAASGNNIFNVPAMPSFGQFYPNSSISTPKNITAILNCVTKKVRMREEKPPQESTPRFERRARHQTTKTNFATRRYAN
jgi:hypothetical protein